MSASQLPVVVGRAPGGAISVPPLLYALPRVIVYGLTLTLGPTPQHWRLALVSPCVVPTPSDLYLRLSSCHCLSSSPLSFSCAVASFAHPVSRQCNNQLDCAALLHLHPPLLLTSFLCALVSACPSLWLIVVCRRHLALAADAVKV
jgi:hypothetical protein